MGEFAALTSSAVWAMASILFTRLSRDALNPLALNTLKCTIALLMMFLTIALWTGNVWPYSSFDGATTALLASGLLGITLGDTAFFGALRRLGPRRTLALSALTPPLTAIIAWPALGEPLTLKMLSGMVLTLGGVLWVVAERTQDAPSSKNPKELATNNRKWGLVFGILAVACQAGGNILTKLGGERYDALEMSILRVIAGTLGLALVVVIAGQVQSVIRPLRSPRRVGLLVIATFLGTYLGIWLMVAGLRHASAGIASTLNSTSPIFILPLAFIFLGDRPSLRAIAGACLAVLGIAVLFL